MFIDHIVFSSEAVVEQVSGILVYSGQPAYSDRSAGLLELYLGVQEGVW